MEFDIANLPDDWQVVPVRGVGDVITGRTPSTKREDFYGGEYNLISPADLDNGKYVISAHKRLTKIGFEECRALPKDTILVGCIGNVGKLGMVSDEKSATNQQINAVVCKSDNDPHFIYYSFHANRMRLEKAAHKTTLPILNKTNFENFKIAVPPLAEQRKIASVLGVVQQAIEQQGQLLQRTTELKKTLLHQLFTHGLRGEPQKETEIGPVPESWQVIRFDDFSTLQRGKDLTKSEFRAGTIPVAGSNGVIGCHDVANVNGPGVTVGRSGSVGKVIYYPHDFWAHNTSLYVKDFHGNEPRYVAYHLEQLRLERFRAGASVPTLDRNQFKDMPVAVPQLGEQKEIALTLSMIDKKIYFIQTKRLKLTDLFTGLLQQLMTAQIRVNAIEQAKVRREG